VSKKASANLSRIAEENQLGSFLSLHKSLGAAYKMYLMFAGGGLVLMIPLVFLLGLIEPVPDFPPWAQLACVVGGVGILLWGLSGFVRLPARAIQVHDGGIVYKELGSLVVVPFRDVVGVEADVTTTTQGGELSSRSGRLGAFLKDGREVKFNLYLDDLDAFMKALVNGAAESVVQHVLGSVGRGEAVDSGSVVFTASGLARNETVIPYGSLTHWVDSDGIKFSKSGKEVFRLSRRERIRHKPYLEILVDSLRRTARAS
jgi:hypothetical protein